MFLQKVLATIQQYQMVKQGDHIIVGVSGGADSVTLLAILHALKDRWNLKLTVAHLDHGLRGEASRKEAEFVHNMAEAMGLPCVSEERDVLSHKKKTGLSLQDAARDIRYAFFMDVCNRLHAQKVALGHHADDQAETLLIWLIRGTTPAGLAGIPPVRNGIFIRPLITVCRSEIESYLKERKICYIPDNSADEPQYLRNKIRHQLIPLLTQEYNPKIIKNLVQLSDVFRKDNEILDGMVAEAVDKILIRGNTCSVDKLKSYPIGLRGRIIKKIISCVKGDSRGISSKHIDAICRLLDGAGATKIVQLPAGWSVLREYGCLTFAHETLDAKTFCYTFDNIPTTVKMDEIKKEMVLSVEHLNTKDRGFPDMGNNIACLDFDAVKLPMIVRNHVPGDRFYPLGLGGSKKLKDFFIDSKIPLRIRKKIPVLLFQNKIAWVSGLRIDHRFRLKPNTKKMLKIRLT
jgi:tRNA(Ile)-lysidine synthase